MYTNVYIYIYIYIYIFNHIITVYNLNPYNNIGKILHFCIVIFHNENC